ncbi:acyl carrier protein [Thermodesulfobacteriota bacterium B35]
MAAGTTREKILENLVQILEDMTADWDMELDDPIGEATRLMADLEFESIDVVQFIVAIEERFQRRGMPFEELLMEDGRYVDEITVRDTVDFLDRHLGQ